MDLLRGCGADPVRRVLKPQHLSTAPGRVLRPRHLAQARRVTVLAWIEVTDPATGRPYYWNQQTNETQWERPADLQEPADGPFWGQAETAEELRRLASSPDPAGMGWEELTEVLLEAVRSDPSGASFGETARGYRTAGVFDEGFNLYLSSRIEGAPNKAARELLVKLQARLSNPLLRQPAPFEF